MTLRVALVGAGAMGTIMARDIYPALRNVAEVVAVVDRDPDRAGPLAAALGARAYASLDQAAAAEELSAVDIRLPHAAHAPAALAALERGLHVLVEKPLAMSVEDCSRIADAADRAERVVAVAENYPHIKAVRAARAALDDGVVGELLALRSTRSYTLEGVWARTAWRQGNGPMAGVLWDQGTHHTSMLRALAGDVVTVSAHTSSNRTTPGVEVLTLELGFASGVAAQSLYCWGSPGRPVEIEGLALGTAGYLEIAVSYGSADGEARLGASGGMRPISPKESYYDSHRWIVEDWAAAIAGARTPLVGVRSATEDVRVVLAARRSLERGGAVVDV